MSTVNFAVLKCDGAAFSLSTHALHCCGWKYFATLDIYAASLQSKYASTMAIENAAVFHDDRRIKPLGDGPLQLQRIAECRIINENSTYKNIKITVAMHILRKRDKPPLMAAMQLSMWPVTRQFSSWIWVPSPCAATPWVCIKRQNSCKKSPHEAPAFEVTR